MAIRIRFQGGALAGEIRDFDDTRTEIRFGRNRDTCDVVFPPNETLVSREHFVLRRVLGQYRLVTNRETPVYVEGELGRDDQIIDSLSELQIGKGGPKILVEILGENALLPTDGFKERRPSALEAVDEVSQRTSRARTLATVALFGGLLALAAGWIGYRIADARIARANERVDELGTAVVAEAQAAKAAFRPIVREIEPSVYLVCLRYSPDGEGSVRPVATAWVVAPGVLATNAHVASEFNGLQKGQSLFVRSMTGSGSDVTIESVRIHPGFELFGRLVEASKAFDPVVGSMHSAGELGACDVALMAVAPAQSAKLSRPLTLATAEELSSLSVGEDLGMLGFPMEGLHRGGVSVQHPQPTFQQGSLTGMTDFFLARRDASSNELLHVNLAAAGGASGSPVFLRNGHVVGVFSAGNSFQLTEKLPRDPGAQPGDPDQRRPIGPRIPVGGVNYAQRIDMLRDLMSGTADKDLPARETRWRAELDELFKIGADAIFVEAERALEARTGHQAQRLKSESGKLTAAITSTSMDAAVGFDFVAPEKGAYAALVVADRPVDIDAVLTVNDKAVLVDNGADYTPSLQFQAAKSIRFRILVLTSDPSVAPETTFRLRVYRLE